MASGPAAVVEAYFACMRAGDEGVADLFHDDARLVGLGTVVAGRDAIRSFYAESIRRAGPAPRLVAPFLVEGPRVGAEILIDLNDGSTLHVLDLFVVEDGLIRSLTYFVADHPADP